MNSLNSDRMMTFEDVPVSGFFVRFGHSEKFFKIRPIYHIDLDGNYHLMGNVANLSNGVVSIMNEDENVLLLGEKNVLHLGSL